MTGYIFYIRHKGWVMGQADKMLNYIHKEENLSQRKIARYMGLSLGQINFLLHDMVKKGFLKIEKISPRNVKYILTPEGIAKNAKRAYNSLVYAIKNVLTLQEQLLDIIREYSEKGYSIYLDNEKDEVCIILKQVIRDKKLGEICRLISIEEITNVIQNTENINGNSHAKELVICWAEDREKAYKQLGFRCMNILVRINRL